MKAQPFPYLINTRLKGVVLYKGSNSVSELSHGDLYYSKYSKAAHRRLRRYLVLQEVCCVEFSNIYCRGAALTMLSQDNILEEVLDEIDRSFDILEVTSL